ncbi:MAG: glycosyltransferase family 2 protein [Candidatus Eremiobacteraeota bacterium]|nr:glycosyltransferase family 2 protein [Candidatus Eremiobacteraeota bacterium]
MPAGCSVLVLDSLSTDGTADVARAHGAIVIEREWRGFMDARTFALAAVRTPWTLMIDADEVLDDDLRSSIVAANGDVDGYRVARTTFFCGRAMRIWTDERILRLFRTDRARLRSRGMSDQAEVHEVWSIPGMVSDLSGVLLHYSYPSVASYRSKYERYTDLEAMVLRAAPKHTRIESLKALLSFLNLLFLRGGIFDGWRGIYAAWWSSRYRLISLGKAAKSS